MSSVSVYSEREPQVGGGCKVIAVPLAALSESTMGKAHVDPTELRRFARDLKRANGELQALMTGLHAKVMNLEKTWRDQEQQKFAEQFEQTFKNLSVFLKASEQHVLFLARKAGQIEDYLQQR
jgi:uncharacterized protein YukE